MRQKLTLQEWLKQIEECGSVNKAAKKNQYTRSYVSLLFTQLPEDDPLKVRYNELRGKRGRPLVEHDIHSDPIKANQQAYYLTYKAKKTQSS